MKIGSVGVSNYEYKPNKSLKKTAALSIGAISALSLIKGKYAALDNDKFTQVFDFEKLFPALYLAVAGVCFKMKEAILGTDLYGFTGKQVHTAAKTEIYEITTKNLHQG